MVSVVGMIAPLVQAMPPPEELVAELSSDDNSSKAELKSVTVVIVARNGSARQRHFPCLSCQYHLLSVRVAICLLL